MNRLAVIYSKTFLAIVLIKLVDIVKNLIIASYLGVSNSADIFAGVISIPDGIIVLVGIDSLRGIVNSEYSTLYSNNDIKKLEKSFNNLFKLVLLVGFGLMIFITIFRKNIVDLLLPGFLELKKIRAYDIALIVFPVIFIKSLIALFQSVYNSVKKFTFPVLVQVIISLTMVVFILLPFYKNDLLYNLSFGLLVGNILLFFILYIGIHKYGFKFSFEKISLDEVTKKVLKSCGSIAILVFINQIYLYSRNFFASNYGDGAISSLSYASTISTTLTALAFGTIFSVLLSDLASSYNIEKKIKTKNLYTNTFLSLVFIFCPLIIFLLINAREILSIIYLRGNITSDSIDKILTPFYWECLSILSWMSFIIPTSLFLALKQYKLLTILGSISYFIGIALNFFLTNSFGYYGISISSFLTSGFYGLLLTIYARKFLGRFDILKRDFSLILLTSTICFTISYFLKEYFLSRYFEEGFPISMFVLLINFVIVLIVYLFFSTIFHVNYFNKFKSILRKS